MSAASTPSPRSPSPPLRRRRWVWAVVACVGAAVAGVLIGVVLLGLSLFKPKREDLLTQAVKEEYLPVTVVERGTLESANNIDVVCKVKAGSRGTFASTIKWVIDDGTLVGKGDPILDLDDSALKDQEQSQSILVAKANSLYIKAKEDLSIQLKSNESDLAAKLAALKVAELDLEKFLGVRREAALDALGAVAMGPATIIERGEYRMKYDDVSGRLKLAESDLEAYRDRSAWAERAVKLGYLTPSQAKVERSKLDSALDNFGKLQAEKFALENFTRARELTNLISLFEVARAAYEQAVLQAHAKQVQMEAELQTNTLVLQQELDKLGEIQQQLSACKVTAPQAGMIVYYKDPSSSSRYGSSTQGLIAVGEQVKEGQKLLRIPDLTHMQTTAKIHEALVSRIKGDDRRPTEMAKTLNFGFLLNPHAFSRMVSQSDHSWNALRDSVRDKEYTIASMGQPAIVRVDSFPDRIFKGRVKSVALVASAADFFSSDVKLYPTIVSIDEGDMQGLKPDMSAEVTIQVDPAETKVLTVPIQAVVGGAELGTKRKLFVMNGDAPEERDVELGLFNDKMVEVKSGVKAGELVVLNPKVIVGDKAKTRDEAEAPRGPRTGAGGKAGDKSKGGKPNAPGASGAQQPKTN
jgi:multidrug efflux pump subunit AcrA (membrane-fusion protein)